MNPVVTQGIAAVFDEVFFYKTCSFQGTTMRGTPMCGLPEWLDCPWAGTKRDCLLPPEDADG